MSDHMADAKLILFNMSKVNSQQNISIAPSTSISNSEKPTPEIFTEPSNNENDIEIDKYRSIEPLEVITEDGDIDKLKEIENKNNLKKLTSICINNKAFGSRAPSPNSHVHQAWRKVKKFNHAFDIIQGNI